MTYSFNVLIQPWIPVQSDLGVIELGILDVLAKAYEFDAILDPSPLVQFGLYRLLITFIMDAYDIQEFNQLEDLLQAGRFEMDRISEYVYKCGNCFDLFDHERPFLQSPADPKLDKEAKSIANLFQHLPTGTNAIHFHHVAENGQAYGPGVCARGLCTIAPFMTSGGSGYAPSINGVPPWYTLIRGHSFFETLVLNCICDPLPYGLDRMTPPTWRENENVYSKDVTHASLLEGLTWQPRRIRLLPGHGGICSYAGREENVLVSEMIFSPGFKARVGETWTDPQVAYGISEKGRRSVRPQEERELWRDTGPLLLLQEKEYRGAKKIRFEKPLVVTQFRQLAMERIIDSKRSIIVEAYGAQTDKMKFFEWRFDRLVLPAGLYNEEWAGSLVQDAVDQADLVAYFLGKALKKAYPREGKSNKAAFDDAISNCKRAFWDVLRHEFNRFLDDLSTHGRNDIDRYSKYIAKWRVVLRDRAVDALEEVLDDLDADAGALERQVAARDSFYLYLRKAFQKI